MQALDATTADGVAAALAAMTSLEAEAAIQARGGVAAAVRSRQEWLNSEMGSAAGTGPWIELRLADGGTAGPKPRHCPATTHAAPWPECGSWT
jgi:hypothetical protein